MTTRLASTPDRSRIEQGRKSWSRISLDANYLGSSRRTRPLGIWAEHRDPAAPLFDNLHQAVRSDGGLLDHLVQRGAAFPPRARWCRPTTWGAATKSQRTTSCLWRMTSLKRPGRRHANGLSV